jgi:3'-phosphoadenosine 5'-phosphosulfate sulfotransferase (PAPS reductase)/FAD synthetase
MNKAVSGAELREDYRTLTLDQKIESAHVTILEALEKGSEPRLLCSFGKDSLVMLDLLAPYGVRKSLFLYDTDEIIDWEYIQKVVDLYKVELIPLSKGRAVFHVLRGTPMLLSFPYITPTCMLPIPTNVHPYQEGDRKFTCIDHRLRTVYGPALPDNGDLMFLGQKLTDLENNSCLTVVNSFASRDFAGFVDKLAEQGEHFDIAPGLPACTPIKFWTDDDVWDYIEMRELPWSKKVYRRRQ